MSAADLLSPIVDRLHLAGIPYMLTGSFAAAFHGRPRATQDMDFVIAADAEQVRSLVNSLPAEAYYVDVAAALVALRDETQFNVIDMASGWKIDFLIRKSRPFSRVEFERRTLIDLDGLSLYITTVEDLILAKLEWGRLGQSGRQLEDVAGLLAVRGEDLDRVYLARWVDQLDLAEEWARAKVQADGPGPE